MDSINPVLIHMDVTMQDSSISNGSLEEPILDPNPVPKTIIDLIDYELNVEEPSSQESSDSSINSPVRRSLISTGCCYDDRMKLHANADFSANPHHPEDPRRIEAIMREFKTAKLVYDGSDAQLQEILKQAPTKFMTRIPAREATAAEICTVHTADHYEWVRQLGEKSSAELRRMTAEMDNGRKSLYVGNLTYEAALISAGGAIETCKNVVAGQVKNAIAVIRPPGHHAEYNESLGFCIFNNVPIAAKVCMQEYPDICRKVLILDWDVHHGNGIQNMFYNDPNVLYISLHVYQGGSFYPGQPDYDDIPDGGLDKCGAGIGIGKNINIGWHDQGMGDGEYMAAFQRIVMPVAQEFDPDLVIVSAGFDAAAGDELGGCFVSPACYSHMTHMLMSLANGKVAVCLEGGYNLHAISRSALSVARTLMGEPPERMVIPPLNKAAAKVLDEVKRHQAPYWQCIRPSVIASREVQDKVIRLNDVIRIYQRRILSQKYSMLSLYIQREKLYKVFEDQVLVSPNIYIFKKILLIIHDPPELIANPDPDDNAIYSHNAFMNDGVIPYIDWAVANGYGIMDVNMPLATPEDVHSTVSKSEEAEVQLQTKELLCYLWDNYIENYACSSLVLMGVGDSYIGIKQLLTSREAKDKIACVLSFVSGSLRPVRSDTDPYLSDWYKKNSLIYVSPDHACWTDEDSARKVRKNRFGRVAKGRVEGLGNMLYEHKDEAQSWIKLKVDARLDPDDTEDESAANPESTEAVPVSMRTVVSPTNNSRSW